MSIHPLVDHSQSQEGPETLFFGAYIAKMSSSISVTRVGLTLALCISSFLFVKRLLESAQSACSDEGEKPSQKLGESPGDDFPPAGLQGSSASEPSEARRKAAEAAQVRANWDISQKPTMRRLGLTTARHEPEGRKVGL